ncbi:MAG: hypothetical protein U0520_05280 [Candidatus Saccharimonadales bacterium]
MAHPVEDFQHFPTVEDVANVTSSRFAYTVALRGLLASMAASETSDRVNAVSLAMATIVSCDELGDVEPPLSSDLSNLLLQLSVYKC